MPLFERDLQSLKGKPCQDILPKVQFATKTLPKDFSVLSKNKKAVST
jgi:hypothetical protein